MHLNIRSSRHKIDYILDNFTGIDILCFSETHLDFNVSTESLRFSNSTRYKIQAIYCDLRPPAHNTR